MATYTFEQLKSLWTMYGGPPEVANVAAAIALAESGGRSDATNTSNSNGSIDRGLWQINSVHGADSSYDIATNVRAAVRLYKSKNNFSDWTVFKSGAYKKFLNGNPDVSTGGSATNIGIDIPNPLDALRDIADRIGTIIKAGEWFADVRNVIRIVQVMIGGALLLVGISILNVGLTLKTADTPAGKAVISAVTKGAK